MSAHLYVHRLEMETLSPVLVAAGPESRLSPYTDFVQDGLELLYLDERKLEHALGVQPAGMIDEFVRGVQSRMNNNRSEFDLSTFIRNRLGVHPATLTRRRVPVQGRVYRNHVRRHISNGGQPYIPGSTLKGAIRAAALYGWLTETSAGRRCVDRLAKSTELLWERHASRLQEAEAHFREGRKRDGERLASAAERDTREALAPSPEQELFGAPLGDRTHGSEMRFLRVSDSDPLPASCTRVAQIARFKLADASMVSPQWSEVIPRGVRTGFTVSVEPRFTRPGLEFLNDRSPEPLLRCLDAFAADNLKWELDTLDELGDTEALDDVYDAVVDIDEYPSHAGNANLRIGAGKTYFDNSVGLALRKKDPHVFERFRRLLGLGRNPREKQFSGKRFPATRSYVMERVGEKSIPREPLGWVRVTIAQQIQPQRHPTATAT
jgi:CRISPR type III-A-associated RAMP protein Csm5